MTTGTPGNDNLTNDPNVNPETIDALAGDDTITVTVPLVNPGVGKTINVEGDEDFDILNISAAYLLGTGSAGSVNLRSTSSGTFSALVNYTTVERLILSGAYHSGQIVTGDTEDWITITSGTLASFNVQTGGNADRVFAIGSQPGGAVLAGSGDDLVDLSAASGGSAQYFIRGGEGDDTLTGTSGFDTIFGDEDDDVIDGRGSSNFADNLSGGTGNDTFTAYGQETITENPIEGTDEVRTALGVYTLPANVENLTHTGTGSTGLRGNGLDNIVTGGSGHDVILLQDGGADRAVGGGGNDLVYFGAAYDGASDKVDGGANADQLQLQGDYPGTTLAADALTGVELIILMSSADNSFGGGSGDPSGYDYNLTLVDANIVPGGGLVVDGRGLAANETLVLDASQEADGHLTLYGGAGDDSLLSGAGNDLLNGGAGADLLAGGDGGDIYYVDVDDYVREAATAAGGFDSVYSSSSFTLPTGEAIELLATSNYTLTVPVSLAGNEFDNKIVGNDGVNNLYGLAGNDHILGLAGADILDGGAGSDVVEGGTGDDIYFTDGLDVIFEAVSGGQDAVYTTASYALAGGVAVELLGTQNFTLTTAITLSGNEFANKLVGNDGVNDLYGQCGDDHLAGLAGGDFLDGGAGADILEGGMGDDIYYVDNGLDLVLENDGAGFDQVYVSASYALAGGASVELLGTQDYTQTTSLDLTGNNEFGNKLVGNNGVNNLYGLGGNDHLIGLDGNDVLDGGAGADLLEGGSGADTIRFAFFQHSVVGSADILLDFVSGTDRIDLSAIDANANTAGDDAFTFIGTGAFTNQAGQLRYDASGAVINVFGDVDGNGGADLHIVVYSPAIAGGDFIL